MTNAKQALLALTGTGIGLIVGLFFAAPADPPELGQQEADCPRGAACAVKPYLGDVQFVPASDLSPPWACWHQSKTLVACVRTFEP